MRHLSRILAVALVLIPGALSAKKVETVINVIPYPQSVTLGKGAFKGAGANFNCDPAIDAQSARLIRDFADKITFVSGRTNSVATPIGLDKAAAEGGMKGFVFLKDGSMGPEEYSIDIKKKTCLVKASAYSGFLYAIQTLKQMLPAEVYGGKKANAAWLLPCVTVLDAPRFDYRGIHLDPCRHFWTIEETKRYIDIAAAYKLNRLHWHLTEDQGWRMEIKKYPKLTEVGAWRSGTCIGKDFDSSDGIRYGGFYTQDQMREIVAYAAERNITVIPEMDLPGHMVAALAAYPELGCTGGPYDVWTRWGVSEDVLCVGKEETFTFLEDVLTEMLDIFPSEYIHIGGDECPKVRWETASRSSASRPMATSPPSRSSSAT